MDIRIVIVTALVVVACVASAEKQPYERYKSIVDRQMFGPLPPNFDPDKAPSEVAATSRNAEKQLTQEQQQLKSAVHFSVINIEHDGKVKVGFSDSSNPQKQKFYYLAVGESQDGWTVESADPDTAEIVLAKDEIVLELTLGQDSAKGGGTTSARANHNSAKTLGNEGLSIAGRRSRRAAELKLQQDALKREKEAFEAKRAEEKEEKARQEAEREAEREENRRQLMAIQEELKKQREAAAKNEEAKKTDENNDAE